MFCSDSLLFFGGLAGNLHPRVVRVLKVLKVFDFHSVESALFTQTAQSWRVLLSVYDIFFAYEAPRTVNCDFVVVRDTLEFGELFGQHVFGLHFFAENFSQRYCCLVLRRRQGSFLLKFPFDHNVNRIRTFPLRVNYLLANALTFLHEVDKLLNRCPLHSNEARYRRQEFEQLVRTSLLDFTEWSVEVAFVQHAVCYFCQTFDCRIASVVWVDQRQLTESLTLTKYRNLIIVHSVGEVKVPVIDAKGVVGHKSIWEQIFKQLFSQFDNRLALDHHLLILDRRVSTFSYTFWVLAV